MNRRARIRIRHWIVCVLLVPACGESSRPEPPGSTGSPGSDVVQLVGGERLAWTQSAASVEDLHTHAFRLYIDNTGPIALTDVRCSNEFTNSGYECSAPLPELSTGAHTLVLTSLKGGVESSRSAPISVFKTSGRLDTSRLLEGRSASEPARHDTSHDSDQVFAVPPQVCFASHASDCYDVGFLASGTGRVVDLISTGDGRLLFVEEGRRLRLVEHGAISPHVALEFSDPSARILGVAVGPAFATARLVYVAWSDEALPDHRVLYITRYREIGGALGEGATVVAGPPISESSSVPLAVTASGFIYAAIPSSSDDMRPGAILRYDAEGRVPRENRSGSPVVALGFSRPTAVAVDATSDYVWLGGERLTGTSASIARLDATAGEATPWTGTPASPKLALMSALRQDNSAELLIAANDRLLLARLDATFAIREVSEAQPRLGEALLAATAGPQQSWIVMTGSERAWSIFQLTPRRQ